MSVLNLVPTGKLTWELKSTFSSRNSIYKWGFPLLVYRSVSNKNTGSLKQLFLQPLILPCLPLGVFHEVDSIRSRARLTPTTANNIKLLWSVISKLICVFLSVHPLGRNDSNTLESLKNLKQTSDRSASQNHAGSRIWVSQPAADATVGVNGQNAFPNNF